MKKMNKNENIKCDVENCIYNKNKNYCTLDTIKISCTCCSDEVESKNETICNSFENIEHE